MLDNHKLRGNPLSIEEELLFHEICNAENPKLSERLSEIA